MNLPGLNFQLGEDIDALRDAVRDFAAAALRRVGYRALTAESAEDALEVLTVEPDISLLVTDIAMPGMNGRELAERASQRWPSLKVLLVLLWLR